MRSFLLILAGFASALLWLSFLVASSFNTLTVAAGLVGALVLMARS